jgi:hypothetical protein
MKNTSSKDSPVLSTRFHRYYYGTVEEPAGFGSWDGLYWVADNQFYYNGLPRGTVSDGQKSFAAMDAYIVIMPDKKYYNVKSGVFGSMEASYTGEAGTFSYGDGKYKGVPADNNAIITTGAPFPFNEGDSISISGNTTIPANNRAGITVQGLTEDRKTMYFYENVFYIPDGADKPFPITEALSFARTVPDMDFICENNNRLWGCRHNTIYATGLGTIFDWGSVLANDDTSSWAANVASEGDFTGCYAYRSTPMFFKEDEVYRVYGDLPSNFTIQHTATLGVMEGSSKSLAIAGETLFYLSRTGVMAYDGGRPASLAAAFGNERYRNGVAGSDGTKYYISMSDRDGETRLYVFDTVSAQWHIEDESVSYGFAVFDENLYMMNVLGEIYIIGDVFEPPDGTFPEPDFPWYVEFGDFIESEPYKKEMPKILLRLELAQEARCTVKIRYDSKDQWYEIYTLQGTEKQSYYLPLIPHRCDHYRLRFEGEGDFRLWSLTREYATGSPNRSYRT